jgi:hypothetical protein
MKADDATFERLHLSEFNARLNFAEKPGIAEYRLKPPPEIKK